MTEVAPHYLALDVGRTRMTAATISVDHQVIASAVTATPRRADAAELLDTAIFALNVVLSAAVGPVAGLGVSCPGPLKLPSGDVSPHGITAWRDFPLRDQLAERVGVPVLVDRDAVCLALGEYLAVGGRANVLGVLTDDIVTSGVVLAGSTTIGGDIAHVVVARDGRRCRCGAHGCLASIADREHILAAAADRGVGASDIGELVATARGGDAEATAVLNGSGMALGTAIASAAAMLDLDVVAIGGELSQAADLVLDGMYAAWERHAGTASNRRCRVLLAASDSRLIGAAGLFRIAREPG